MTAVLLLWLLLLTTADVWWPVTLVMYGPRWPWAIPSLLLIPPAVARARRSLGPLLAGLVVAFGPMMGFSVPWRAGPGPGAGHRPGLRVLTCNVHGPALDVDALAAVIADARPDLVALQEWPPAGDPSALLPGPGWHIRVDGEVCLASRFPIGEVGSLDRRRLGGKGSAVRYRVGGPAGDFAFVNVHLKSPRDGLAAALRKAYRAGPWVRQNALIREGESRAVSEWAGGSPVPILLGGDFNLPDESAIFRRFWSGYSDAFACSGWGYGRTWYSSWHGVRIDHVLAGPGWQFRRCWTGPFVGSDHRAVIADVEWVAPPG